MIEMRWFQKAERRPIAHMPSCDLITYVKVLQIRHWKVPSGWTEWQEVPVVSEAST